MTFILKFFIDSWVDIIIFCAIIYFGEENMNLLAINGSHRKKGNTATILQHVMSGAQKAQLSVKYELINRYDISYKGCISCYECKRLGGRHYGKCVVHNGLTEVLEKSKQVDCLVFGSPIFSSDATGMMRCYWERLFSRFLHIKKYIRRWRQEKYVQLLFIQ